MIEHQKDNAIQETLEELDLTSETTEKKHLRNYFCVGVFAFGFNFITTLEYVSFRGVMKAAGILQEVKISVLLAITIIGLCIGAVIGGVLNDNFKSKYGQRAPFIFIGTILTSLLLLFVPIITEFIDNFNLKFGVLIVLLLISHISLGFAYSPWLALVPDFFRNKELITAATIISILGAIGAAVATLCFEPLLDANLSWIIWIITGIVFGLSGILAAVMLPKINHDITSRFRFSEIIKLPITIWKIGGRNWSLLLIASAFWAFSSHLVETGIVDSLTNRFDVKNTLAAFGSNILMGIYIVILLIPLLILINKIGKKNSSIIACIVYSVFCILLATMRDFDSIYYIALIGGIGNIFISTLQIALPAEHVPREKAASYLGFFFVFSSIMKPIAYLIQGLVIETDASKTTLAEFGGYPWVFLIAALGMLASMLFFVFLKEKDNPDVISKSITRLNKRKERKVV